MDGKFFQVPEFSSELCEPIVKGVALEQLAQVTGLKGTTIICFPYKSKDQIPNLNQFVRMLDRAAQENPMVVVLVIKMLAARYQMFAESLDNLGREVRRHNGG